MIYKTEKILLTFSPDMEDYVKSLQKDFMPEDTQTGMIQLFWTTTKRIMCALPSSTRKCFIRKALCRNGNQKRSEI